MPNEPVGDYVLTLSCEDRPGIVHAVTSFLMEHGGNIMESQQFGDQQAGRFFMRIDFELDDPDVGRRRSATDFAATAAEFEMDFELWSASAPYRTLIMVSKQLHCLNDLLFRHSTGDLQIEVVGVVSNHLDAEPLVKSHGLAVPPPARHSGHEGRRRGAADGTGRAARACTWSCWPATCRSSPTGCAGG